MSNGKVALVIIFNHRYDKNINILRKLYAGRFSNLFFIVPFYTGTEANVISVYENSYNFQGYLAQGFPRFYHTDFDQYFFVADDMILNPAINESNYASFFGIKNTDNYLPQIFNLHHFENGHTLNLDKFKIKGKNFHYWMYTRSILQFSLKKKGVECVKELPAFDEAAKILEWQGYPIQPLKFIDIADNINWEAAFIDILKRYRRQLIKIKDWNRKIELPYPVVAGYSDIAIVNKATMQQFAHYCGVFAALDLWVEIALPTALLLASDTKVVTETETGKRGILYWNENPEAIRKFQEDMDRYHYKLSELLSAFPPDKLYIHPVKLSKWTNDLSDKSGTNS